MGESYSGIRALADFIRDVTKYQHSPIGISSEGCDPAPPALLEDSATSEGVAAAGALSSTTRLCLGAGPGLQSKAKMSDNKT